MNKLFAPSIAALIVTILLCFVFWTSGFDFNRRDFDVGFLTAVTIGAAALAFTFVLWDLHE